MNVKHTTRAISFGLLLGFAALSGSAFADGQTERWYEPQIKKLTDEHGMVAKKDVMRMVEKKFDAMDTAKKGTLSEADVKRIFRDSTGS